MKIGYGKLGRSMPLTLAKCGYLGGDVECVAVVKQLAERHPNDEFWLLGRNSGERPEDVGLPPNVFNPWTKLWPAMKDDVAKIRSQGALTIERQLQMRDVFDDHTRPLFTDMDAHVWWVGQHGTTNAPVPSVQRPGTLTKPHDWSIYYASFILRGINAWRDVDPWSREEVWLNADPRNYLKMRDLKWPLRQPVVSQFNFTNTLKHERYGSTTHPGVWGQYGVHDAVDPYIWISTVANTYSRLEVNGLAPETPFGGLLSFNSRWDNRRRFGLFINEARREVTESRSRRVALRDYVLPLQPDFIHGTWSPDSQRELGRTISPVPWGAYVPTLQSVKSTFTTPSSGSGWATTKPWEAFAAGTVCFFHPLYDVQNNILADAHPTLRHFLRVSSPAELRSRVDEVDREYALFYELVNLQRDHFERNVTLGTPKWITEVEKRIWK